MRSTHLRLITLVALSVAIAACGGAKSSGPAANLPVRVVNDDMQRPVNVPVDVKRAVSLAPSVTENVFAVGAGDRLVGVTTFCNYPEEAKGIAKIGDTMTPNMEAIVALKPDVVLVSTASQVEAFTKTLAQNHIAVYVMDPATLTDVFNSLERLAALFGTTDKLQKVLPGLRNRAGDVELKAGNLPKTRVFVQISREPLFTIGKTAFLNDVINKAGGASVTADVETAFPKLSKETASALDPEVIILSDSEDDQEPNEAFKNSAAVKNGRVYKINADIISRPGPRLVDALEQIAKDLHPERFK
ncbi:MAG TPA: cobalamin-binding protein [Pyrinomonadaceae bacterium]|nr:cobalamin-binding protein [Pyrinomonadaceae bacterium]